MVYDPVLIFFPNPTLLIHLLITFTSSLQKLFCPYQNSYSLINLLKHHHGPNDTCPGSAKGMLIFYHYAFPTC